MFGAGDAMPPHVSRTEYWWFTAISSILRCYTLRNINLHIMKKLLLLPLLVGVFFVCFTHAANTIMPNKADLRTESISSAGTLNDILAAAVLKCQEEFGVEMSLEEMLSGYQAGTVILTEIVPGEAWEIRLSDGILIAIDIDML